MKEKNIRKLTIAGVLVAVAVVGSLFSIPVFGAKCSPVQHMVNVLGAVLLGPGYAVGMAFAAALIRNLLGLGSLLAFPGSMIGALLGGVLGAGVFWLVGVLYLRRRGVEGLGFGDVKLMLMIGFLVTAELLPLIVIMAGLAAVLGFAVTALLRKSVEGLGSMEMPFGPYLCLTAWVTLLWGRDIWRLWIQFILSI